MVFPVKVLDTSFLVAFYLSGHNDHKRAIELAKLHAEEAQLLPEVILFETLTVLNYKIGLQATYAAYQEMLGNRAVTLVNLSPVEKLDLLDLFFLQKNKLSVADCSVIYLARKHKAGVLSFDRGVQP